MWLVVLGIFMAICLVVVFAVWASTGDEWYNTVASFVSICLGVFTGFVIIVFCFTAWDWAAAEYRAKIINREYGTDYTQEEVFYGSKVIETIRQIDRKRIEINGNLLKDK
jgi:glucan phosphoethanolaminetransferase (alkaline phosphatase superfamily)